MKTGVAVFLKYPTPGKVKTRLAEAIGEKEAATAYQWMTETVLQTLEQLNEGFSIELHVDPTETESRYRDHFHKHPFPIFLQEGSGLGDRLGNALKEMLGRSPSAIAIGTDCVDLTPALMEKAARALTEADVVIGPSRDGGYYLIGMNRFQPEIFEEIPWSTASVMPTTLQRIHSLKLKLTLLDPLSDIDTVEEWNKVKSRLA